MSKYTIQRPRHQGEIQRLHEQARVADLSPAAAAHEAPELLLPGPSLPRRLLLESAEGSKLALSSNDLLHGGGAKSADQLVFQVLDANVETQPFHVGAVEAGAEAGPRETAPELALLGGVAEAGQSEVEPRRAEPIQEPSDRLRSSDRHNGDALSLEISTPALCERCERALVADAFDEHDGT